MVAGGGGSGTSKRDGPGRLSEEQKFSHSKLCFAKKPSKKLNTVEIQEALFDTAPQAGRGGT
jgi:hypothetical protein